jgi:DNA invertase Pin-like site-specific DNA recombinase/DNA-binding transcriptional MerR regulator
LSPDFTLFARLPYSGSVMSQDRSALIPAVVYLRKSAKGVSGERSQKQKKSLSRQKEEIVRLARGRFQIVKWFQGEGISGWKRGAKRSAFQRMIEEAQGLGAKALLCDNIDRFSRTTYDDVHEDASELRKRGVRWIVTASSGEFDLGPRSDTTGIIKFAAAVWAARESRRSLGRRIAQARRDRAEEGKRSGGRVPYGLVDDGDGGLRHGDPEKVEVVRLLFDQFGNGLKSLNWMADDLNERKVPPPAGKRWYAKTLGVLLRNPAYRGDFRFNHAPRGQFAGINAGGEVVDKEEVNVHSGKVFCTEEAYVPVVDPPLFDKVQRRLDTLKTNPGRRKREGYALTGVLVCAHCGSPMYGTKVKRKAGKRSPAIYRCNATNKKGPRGCHQYQVREIDILSFLLKKLGEEIADIKEMLTDPPYELRAQDRQRAKRRAQVEREREKLADRIDNGEDSALSVKHKGTRESMLTKVSAMRDELDRLDAELAIDPDGGGYTLKELDALSDWWATFGDEAVSVPVAAAVNMALAGGLHQDPFADESAILVHPRKVNEALYQLGCEVRLRWKPKKVKTRAGGARTYYQLKRGRFRLGRQEGDLPPDVLERSASHLPRR